MNCLDFRRGALANPLQIGDEARLHVQECAGCREFLEKQHELDARLFEALQVPAPDGLADRILLSRSTRRARRNWLWSVAASLLLASGLAALLSSRGRDDALGREAVAHVAHEPESFALVHEVPKEFLGSALSDQGLKLLATVGHVTYSRLCPMNGRLARHLVIATAEGPVTMFLMPDDPIARSRAVTETGGMTALTRPARKGSVLIVARARAQALALERALADA